MKQMIFDNVTLPPRVQVENLYPLFEQRETATSIPEEQEYEATLVNALMSNTTDNIRVTLAEDEILYLVINTKCAINISNIITDTRTFNLGSLNKLLKTTLSIMTYFVVLRQDRLASACIKEVIDGTGCHVMRFRDEFKPVTGDEIKLTGVKK